MIGEGIGGKISLMGCTTILMPSLFTAAITPSKAGSEPVRNILMSRDRMSIVGDATAVILGEMVFDALVLGLMAPFCVFIFKDLLARSDPLIKEHNAMIVLFEMCENDVETVMKHPATMIGSDGLEIPAEGKFDPKKVIDKATYVDPHNYSEGIVYVIVNGEVVIEECEQNEVLIGRVLKRN